ncbi:MAG: 1-acyl-sn-glycerol-3-phosphate acyltransferase [Candidatus Obscuribacterales bacterium]|nr:1-acyl-sn-glycerol-3-phosphate acyltransferase [Candidatus Obscuribacterales bacterium]
MNHDTLMPLLLGGILILSIVIGSWIFRVLIPGYFRLRAYCDRVQRCGYLAPPPSERAARRMRRLAGFFTWLMCGKVEVSGRENLDALKTNSFIVTPNHPNMVDVAVIPHVLGRRTARYMAARGVLTAFGGFGGAFFAPMGVFSCDLDRGKGAPAKKAAVEVLVSGQTLVMFPEGWTYLDGKLGKFKRGAVRIAKDAAAEMNGATYVLPVHLRYGKYPGPWILKLNIKLQYLILFVGFLYFRRGVKVTIGKPIPHTALPENDHEATEYLRSVVQSLDPAA